jgi:hypothetical protein
MGFKYNPETNHSKTDTGYTVAPNYSPYPQQYSARLQSVNGCESRNPRRNTSQSDMDYSPYLIRRYTNMSVTDVQLNNGLGYGVAKGGRIPYPGTGFLYGVMPIIPGQTRDNAGGYHRRGPSPYNVQDIFTAGPGSQPTHPGGPGKIASPHFINPMTG